ncbi:MAG TPA: SCO family protein [Candidatus Eisenbacteria bacterium]
MRRIWWTLLVVVLGGVIAIWLAGELIPGFPTNSARSGTLPSFGPAPSFELVDQLGRPFSSTALAGRPWVADFVFTRCAGPCPLMTRRMAALVDTLGPRTPVKFVSFTVDPEYDTPAVLREYAGGFRADPDRWRFLTGLPADLHQVSVNGFHLAMGEAEADSATQLISVAHSTRFILVDAAGQVRGYYDGEDAAAMTALARDAASLARRGR